MKRFLIPILAALMLLAACQPTPDHDFVVQKDTERLVDTVTAKNTDAANEQPDDQSNPLVKTDKHYTYEYTSRNKRLHVAADADVYVPQSGTVPMARLKGEYFTDAFVKKVFDRVYQGTPAYIKSNETRPWTKSELAEMIVYYQDLVDTGRTDDKNMDEAEAIAFIEEMKEEYKTAPDEPTEPEPVVSDGTMRFMDVTNDSPYVKWTRMQYYELWTSGERGELNIRRHAENDNKMTDYFDYCRIPADARYADRIIMYSESENGRELIVSTSYDIYVTDPQDQTCAYGQSVSPRDAVALCDAFLADIGVTDAAPVPYIDTYVIKGYDGKTVADCYYFINYVRTVNGTPAAFLSMMDIVDVDASNDYELPWEYEYMQFIVDREGIYSLDWRSPNTTTQIVSTDAASLTFDDAASVFASMSTVLYEAKTDQFDVPAYYDVQITRVELTLLRIREKNTQERIGLYVPTWVFYGKVTESYGEPIKLEQTAHRATTVVLAINAIDGSIIDPEKGY